MNLQNGRPLQSVATLLLALTLPLAPAARADERPTPPPGTTRIPPQDAQRQVPPSRLISPLPEREWKLPNGDLANTRYSPLNAINAGNVANLKIVSTLSTGIPHGHEGGPLMVDNTLYVVTPFPNHLLAIDLTQPGYPVKWTYKPHPDPRAQGIACCDVVNRGASYVDGKIIYNTLDAHTVAVDAKTGKEVWNTKVGNIDVGETVTMAPLAVKDKVIVGNSGGELGVRGWVLALDVKTGKEVWRAYNTGPDKDVKIGTDFKPFYAKDQGQDLGVKTWPPEQWKLGGSTVWGWISYDPETNLIYYGTGNPGVWNADMRPGDNKWSTTLFARDADTGMAKWAYQFSAHDAWDYDEIMENILIDLPLNGQMRKLLIHPGRAGFIYVHDRGTGELLAADKFEPTNWAHGYDLKTGKPDEDPSKRTHQGTVTKDICPSSTGAKEFVPSSFSPRTGLLYIPAHNTCMDYEGVEANYIAGTPYLGADVKMYPGPGGYQGELIAWDLQAHKPTWSIREHSFPLYSGVLSTAGGVVFYGTMDGWFKAVDDRDGRELWKVKLASGIVGNPMTFAGPDGKQYVAVYSGVGGWMGAAALSGRTPEKDPYGALGAFGAMKDLPKATNPGNVLYVFGL
ncbi:PQQ-dependent dehydrogenase, methanol/ethanol family [Azohydromonas australica]|uniref:PQQ-dependent dehydrogenase, methanol/ethanol family n=1 Tax=Azohydromonas australica TaxID=364039 RepID=UPI000A078E9C|nr:PQQ-dependent dehydrogenase, methanol/ethanol family [Azohydromonas australica]